MEEKDKPVLINVSEALFKSGLFPNVKNVYGAFAICQYGSELGIGPMTSLQTMAIVQGKVCMGAQMMLSLAIKSGVTYKILKDTDEECIISFKRGDISYESSFSISEAKKAGIYKEQSGWTKYPRDMLYWRAVTRGLRRVCPDVISGVYAIEELQDAPPLTAAEPEKPTELIQEKTEQPNVDYELLFMRINEIKNIFELKNWWQKHYKEIVALPPDQAKVLTDIKDYLKKKFEEEQNA